MYKDIKKEKRSKGYFLDAIQAVKDKEESRFFPQGLSLLGVYLDSDYLGATQVLADPYLSASLEDDLGITLDIRLRPESPEDPVIKILKMVLEVTDTGMFQTPSDISDQDKKIVEEMEKLSDLLLPSSTRDNQIDPLITLFFTEDSVELQRFKMLGETYYLFSLTDRGRLSDEIYEHTLYAMFKEKSSDYESFFSSLVGHKLDKNVTRRVLEGVSQKNISGFFVGGVTVRSKVVQAITYAVTSTELNYNIDGDGVERLQIRTQDTSVAIEMDDLDYLEVKVNEAGKYTLKLNLKWDTQIYIYLG